MELRQEICKDELNLKGYSSTEWILWGRNSSGRNGIEIKWEGWNLEIKYE